jgi:hypothetical protein
MEANVSCPLGAMCYSEEVLVDYHLGDRTPEEREAIQAHMNTCSRCAATLLDIKEFFRTSAPGERIRPADLEHEWPEMNEPIENQGSGPALWFHPFSFVCGAVLAGLLVWLWLSPGPAISELLLAQQRLERQTLALDTRLKELTQGHSFKLEPGALRTLTVPPNGFVTLDAGDAKDVVLAEIRRSDSGVQWRQVNPFVQNSQVVLTLARTMLPDGEYSLVLETKQSTRIYRFRVATTR